MMSSTRNVVGSAQGRAVARSTPSVADGRRTWEGALQSSARGSANHPRRAKSPANMVSGRFDATRHTRFRGEARLVLAPETPVLTMQMEVTLTTRNSWDTSAIITERCPLVTQWCPEGVVNAPHLRR